MPHLTCQAKFSDLLCYLGFSCKRHVGGLGGMFLVVGGGGGSYEDHLYLKVFTTFGESFLIIVAATEAIFCDLRFMV